MATGVKPRDEESRFTKVDLENIQDAMKSKKFRDLLVDYCEEVRDPANQALYQEEMTKLEKERGYDVTFINPKGGYVIKTSVAGDRKAFINICSNVNVGKPSCSAQEINGKRGMNWQLPYSIIPPREDYDYKKERCIIYDVVFHPDTLRMAEVNKKFRELVNNTAFEGLQKTYNIHFDSNNFRFPKSEYKGMVTPAVIRKEDPNYKPPNDEETEELSSEIINKLYPQHIYPQKMDKPPEDPVPKRQHQAKKKGRAEFSHSSNNGYTVPKYVIKQQKNVDLQDYTYDKDCKQYAVIPSHIVVEINLPLLSSTKDCILDVKEKCLSLVSEKPAKYKLNITLPYLVNDECGTAKFENTKRILIVSLPVIRQTGRNIKSFKVDSGVESEENSGSQSDDDVKQSFIVELSSTVSEDPQMQVVEGCPRSRGETFFDSSLGYLLPTYTHNVMDDIVAFTFHVKNSDPESVVVKTELNKIFIKFTSVGSGFVPVHYAAIIMFEEQVKFENVTGEAWDNNVILQLEMSGDAPQKFCIGLNEDSFTSEYFDVSQVDKLNQVVTSVKVMGLQQAEESPVAVEVTNLGTETNIVVSSNHSDLDEDDIKSPTTKDSNIVWTETNNDESGAKSILRKPMTMMRSFSESSVGDVASSMDYISSDCIPEESSLKKTVRFNDVIARQFYRYNSSIEGQKKKNQRKKSKKRSQERRKSESEAEDDISNSVQTSKTRLKSALKLRRDSGLADTSDAEDGKHLPSESPDNDLVFDMPDDLKDENRTDDANRNLDYENKFKSVLNIDYRKKEPSEPTIWETTSHAKNPEKNEKTESITCDNIQHNMDLYNPDKLNKGKYLEVMFKNDLIFDLDM